MDDDRKFEISSAVGTTVFFISCIEDGVLNKKTTFFELFIKVFLPYIAYFSKVEFTAAREGMAFAVIQHNPLFPEYRVSTRQRLYLFSFRFGHSGLYR